MLQKTIKNILKEKVVAKTVTDGHPVFSRAVKEQTQSALLDFFIVSDNICHNFFHFKQMYVFGCKFIIIIICETKFTLLT